MKPSLMLSTEQTNNAFGQKWKLFDQTQTEDPLLDSIAVYLFT